MDVKLSRAVKTAASATPPLTAIRTARKTRIMIVKPPTEKVPINPYFCRFVKLGIARMTGNGITKMHTSTMKLTHTLTINGV
jgi:hypothetical protein